MGNGRPVILDTNFLLIPYQFKINIFEQIERILEKSHYFLISSRTLKELEHLATKISKDGRAAKLAIKFVEANKKRIEIVESDVEVDDWIIDYAPTIRAVVCTNDKRVRNEIDRLGLKVISLKNKTKVGSI